MTSLKKNVLANVIGKSWKALLNLACVPIYIKFLGIEAYGVVGIFASLLALSTIIDFGLSTTLTRELARLSSIPNQAAQMRNTTRTIEIIYWIISLVIGLIIATLSAPISTYWLKATTLSVTVVQQSIIIMGFIISLNLVFNMYSCGLVGMQKQIPQNIVIIVTESMRSVGTILILWLISPTLQAFFIWQILITFIQATVSGITLWETLPKNKQPASFKKELLSKTWGFSKDMMGISITTLILNQTDKIILSKILPLNIFGYYSLAWTVIGGLYTFIGPLCLAIFPKLVQLTSSDNKDLLKEFYHKSCQAISVLILPGALIIIFFSPQILILWTQNELAAANTYKLVSILAIGSTLNILTVIPCYLQLAYAKMKLYLFTNLSSAIISIPLTIYLASKFGSLGGAWAWLLLNMMSSLILVVGTHKLLLKGELLKWIKEDVGRPFLNILAILIPGYLIISYFNANTYPIALIILLIMLISSSYIAATYKTEIIKLFFRKKLQLSS